MTNTVQQIADLVQRRSGIALGASRLPALRTAIDLVLPGAAPSELLGLLADPRQGTLTLDRLVDEITINETFFMRAAAPGEAQRASTPSRDRAGPSGHRAHTHVARS